MNASTIPKQLYMVKRWVIIVGMASALAGCSSGPNIVLGPVPPIPLADSADYRHVHSIAFEPPLHGEPPIAYWQPVGVRRISEGLAVDFIIESETDEAARITAWYLGHCSLLQHEAPGWLQLREPGGEVLHLQPGCGTQLMRRPSNMMVTPSFSWQRPDDAASGYRYLTTALFHAPYGYEPNTIEVSINIVPEFGRVESLRQLQNFPKYPFPTNGLVGVPGEWMCFSVRDVRPWVMPK